MKSRQRTHARFFQPNPTSYPITTALCQQLDDSIAPVATASLLLGLAASWLHLHGAADYLMATGLLLHMTIGFAAWLETDHSH